MRHRDPSTTAPLAGVGGPRQDLQLRVIAETSMFTRPLPAQGSIVIGRSPRVDLTIDDKSISRRHARLVMGDVLSIEDLGSVNGTVVAGRRLRRRSPVEVHPGQSIELGRLVLLIHPSSPLDVSSGAPASAADQVVFASEAMRRLLDLIDHAAPTDLSVLLLGETGVGKDVVAQELHRRSARAAGPFLRLDCAALAASVVETELFGQERGSFPGAPRAKAGLFELAEGGTIFFDEVGDLPPALQAKLVRVLETRTFIRIGGSSARALDVRFVAASHRDLDAESLAGTFRRDLYFRLKGLAVRVPPLRERADDVEPLARALAQARAATRIDLSPQAIEVLMGYAWPGNVRELRNAIQHALIRCGPGPIRPEHLPPELSKAPATTAVVLDERGRIVEALERCAGSQTGAAKLLGISRGTLVSRLEKYGLPRPRKPRDRPKT